MSSPRIGSLCSGYGGLDMAVTAVLGGSVAWHSDIDPGAVRILDHHWPDTPNLGDFTTTDWDAVEPVDVLTAGYPCQPFSHAGKRKGETDERHLWPHVREAVRRLRPRLTVLENVAGHRSMGFDRVLGDLAEDGFDAGWVSVRASDVGACHRRERLFIVAHPAGDPGRLCDGDGDAAAHLPGVGRAEGWSGSGERAGQAGQPAGDSGHAANPDQPGLEGPQPARRQNMSAGGVGHPVTLLPTPSAADGLGGHERRGGTRGDELLLAGMVKQAAQFGRYAAAVARWEDTIGRSAPDPTTGGRLNPGFVEWMMGLPPGHVTAVPGLPRTAQLKALGNGVVPQQAACALQLLGVAA